MKNISRLSILAMLVLAALLFSACTAVAPAIIISITSDALETPPQPITGMLQALET